MTADTTPADLKATPRAGSVIGLLAGAHFSHHVLTALIVPLLPFIRNEFGLTYAQAGLVTAAFTITYGVGQLPAGWLADRVGPRYLLLLGITGVAVAGLIVGLSPLFAVLIGGLLIMGIAGGGYHPASSAVIANLVHPSRTGRAMGVHIIGGSTSFFLAPLMAAGLVTALGWRGTFLALSVPVALLGLALFVLISRRMGAMGLGRIPARASAAESAPQAGAGEPEPTQASGGSAGVRPSRSRAAVAHMTFFLILTGIMGAGFGSLIPYLPLYLADVRGVDEAVAAGFLSVIFAAGFFAAPLGGLLSDRLGRVRVLVAAGLLLAPAIVAITVLPFPLPFAAGLLVLGVLMFVRMPTSEAHISATVEKRNRGTVLGIYFFSGAEGSAVLTPLLGATIDRWGFSAGILGMGALVLVAALVCGTAMYAIRRRV